MGVPVRLPLSILDLAPLPEGGTSAQSLRGSVELACLVERLGYERVWFAEHHNMLGIATTTPEILIAHVAQVTSRIRLGAGGVMLPNHAPLKVAESYKLLEALHPGRIDLGLGRAPGTDPVTALALRGSRSAVLSDDFLAQLGELVAFDDGDFPDDHMFRSVRAMPDDTPLPPLWLLGSSDYSAILAAKLGVGFAFAGHFSPEPAEEAMLAYRARFNTEGALEKPHAILALSVFCAETDEAAERMASSMRLSFLQLRNGRPGRLPSPETALAYPFSPAEENTIAGYKRLQIAGNPNVVRAQILAMAERTRADEIMIATHAYDHAARLRSYELLADAFGLGR
ncbi:Luciferase-like [Labilithrix luteola]|uniref:Luciferase-like monooxygenase n=1 Tax=Labilithrix luteola TaxID=1391654 RepID=A0A0K1QEU6_9BACT|nr:LLM class flavin-dependent oxidoreductase [Labilithrix luteola]AKV04192.1 Luciferase-like [Labilithrix luteola]